MLRAITTLTTTPTAAFQRSVPMTLARLPSSRLVNGRSDVCCLIRKANSRPPIRPRNIQVVLRGKLRAVEQQLQACQEASSAMEAEQEAWQEEKERLTQLLKLSEQVAAEGA